MKFAVVHPTLSGPQVADDEPSADACLAAVEQDTGIPGFVRIVPDPAPVPSLPSPYRQYEKRRRGAVRA